MSLWVTPYITSSLAIVNLKNINSAASNKTSVKSQISRDANCISVIQFPPGFLYSNFVFYEYISSFFFHFHFKNWKTLSHENTNYVC